MTNDEGIQAGREIRAKISAEFGNDPERLAAHYVEQQKRHGDRLLEPVPRALSEAANADPSS